MKSVSSRPRRSARRLRGGRLAASAQETVAGSAVPRAARGRAAALQDPSTVETVTAPTLISTGHFNAVATLARRTPGLNLSDSQGNSKPRRRDLSRLHRLAGPGLAAGTGRSTRTAVRINRWPSVTSSTSI